MHKNIKKIFYKKKKKNLFNINFSFYSKKKKKIIKILLMYRIQI